MKKALVTLLTAVTVLSSSLTVFAAPERMPDGGVFDAEYYAQNNPDVVAVLGTDRDVLYSHYTLCGINEGRLPYAPGAEMPAPVVKKEAGTTTQEALLYSDILTLRRTRAYGFLLTDSRPSHIQHKAVSVRWTSEQYPVYDAHGNLIGESIGNSEYQEYYSRYVYDAEGRLISDNFFSKKVGSVVYDEMGKMISFGDYISIWKFQYDEQGYLIKVVSNSSTDYVLSYNEQGKIARRTYIDNRDGTVCGETNFTYDEQGRLIKYQIDYLSSDLESEIRRFYYDAQGRVSNEDLYYDGQLHMQYTYMYE